MRHALTAAVATAAVVIAGSIAGCSAGSAPGSGTSSGSSPAVPALSWHPCTQGGAALQCASMQVPLDYRHPGGRKITLALSEVPATAPVSQRQGMLLFNPGGVHQWNRATAEQRLKQGPGWFEWCWLQVARHMRRSPKPSVGILEVGSSGIVPRVVEL